MAVIAQEGCRGYEEARFTPNHHQEQAAQVRKGVETAPIISTFYTLITGTYVGPVTFGNFWTYLT